MRKAATLVATLALIALSSTAALAADDNDKATGKPANLNGLTLEVGGQIGYATYGSFLRLGAGYQRYLSGRLWLDLGAGVLVRKETDIVTDVGVRIKFGSKQGWRPFVRFGGELAILARMTQPRVVIAGRAGIGAGYFGKGGTGLTFQTGVALGPAFGGGVDFAIASDVMVGAEIPF